MQLCRNFSGRQVEQIAGQPCRAIFCLRLGAADNHDDFPVELAAEGHFEIDKISRLHDKSTGPGDHIVPVILVKAGKVVEDGQSVDRNGLCLGQKPGFRQLNRVPEFSMLSVSVAISLSVMPFR